MGFWIFMLITNVSLPLLMIFFGKYLKNHPPQTINAIFGYRTTRSMKSEEAWLFAQKHFGRQWFRLGLILLPVTVLAMLPCIGKSEDIVGGWGSALCIVLCIALLAPCYFTEKALKQQFDETGR